MVVFGSDIVATSISRRLASGEADTSGSESVGGVTSTGVSAMTGVGSSISSSSYAVLRCICGTMRDISHS